MRGMILAAGRGERMRPLTDRTPKPLLQAGGRSLIEWHLVHLREAGITEVVVNTAWLGEQIEEALGDGRRFGVHIRYSREHEALETAGGIRQALTLLGSEPFMLINGDVWSDYPLTRLPVRPAGLAHLVLVSNPPHHPNGDFRLSGEWIRPVRDGEAGLTYSGMAVIDPALLEGVGPGAQALGPILRRAAEDGRVSGEHWDGCWWDIGTPARLADLREQLDGGLAADPPRERS